MYPRGKPLNGVTSATGVTLKAQDSTDEVANIAVTGTDLAGDDYDTAVFGSTAKGTQITLTLPTSGTGTYKVVQTNPGLSEYFSSDLNVSGDVKTKTYTESDLADGYAFLVTDQGGPIKIEFYKDGTLEKTYNFDVTGVSFSA